MLKQMDKTMLSVEVNVTEGCSRINCMGVGGGGGGREAPPKTTH